MLAIPDYIDALKVNLAHGDATEHTHRPALKTLLDALGGKGITATNEPKRIACGAPDFNITKGKTPLGHVETKDIGVNLDEIERGKGPHGRQFIRYRDGLPNWILTDYMEFRWFVDGEKRLTARLASLVSKTKLKPIGGDGVAELLDAFFKQEVLTITTAKDLADPTPSQLPSDGHIVRAAKESPSERGAVISSSALERSIGSFVDEI